MTSTCIGCGCTDMHACFDEKANTGCHWLEVNREQALGVCSCCSKWLNVWHAGYRGPDHPFVGKYSPWIKLSVSGQRFYFLEPEKHAYNILDIAHSLAQINRFNGHCKFPYSVAQHSWTVSLMVPKEDALAGLLHDGVEAYTGDVTGPLKCLLPDYKVIEFIIARAIYKWFNLPAELPASVKEADMIMLATELHHLMPRDPEYWLHTSPYSPLEQPIRQMTPDMAEQIFLGRYLELTKQEAVACLPG